MKKDRVLTVDDFYDGPRLGIAEFRGVPHIYEAEFDHSSDEYGDTYFLSPVDEELLALVLEKWGIWERWKPHLGGRGRSVNAPRVAARKSSARLPDFSNRQPAAHGPGQPAVLQSCV